MAIKPCGECGSPISDKAEKCPICGVKQAKETSNFVLILAILLGCAGWYVLTHQSDYTTSSPLSEKQKTEIRQASIMAAIKVNLKDSDSAKFEFLNSNCGVVNSKNSFGGYVGNKRFVYVGGKVDLEGYSVSNKEMNLLWKNNCN